MKTRGLVVPERVVQLVSEGGCDVPLSWIGAGQMRPGRPIALFDLKGQSLGLGLSDPENGLLRVLARSGEPFARLDTGFAASRVERAVALRSGLGLVGERSSYRIVHGAGDGLPGLAADVFGGWAVLYAYSEALLPLGKLVATAIRDQVGLRGVVVKVRSRGAAGRHELQQEIVGEAPPERLVVEEHGVPFEIHPLAALNVGLFTDMRVNRQRLAPLAPGRDVLNGFSYTGALSVVCARAGAGSVLSVDLSAGVQRWAKDNFRLSGLDPEDARFGFEAEDVSRYLERAAGEGKAFDLIVLDPPTWSSARGAPWSLERDYPALVTRACTVLRPKGLLWLASNTRAVALDQLAEQGLRRAGREAKLLEEGGLPPDFPTVPAQPDDRYLRVCVFAVDPAL